MPIYLKSIRSYNVCFPLHLRNNKKVSFLDSNVQYNLYNYRQCSEMQLKRCEALKQISTIKFNKEYVYWLAGGKWNHLLQFLQSWRNYYSRILMDRNIENMFQEIMY